MPINLLRNSRVDNGYAYWQNSGDEDLHKGPNGKEAGKDNLHPAELVGAALSNRGNFALPCNPAGFSFRTWQVTPSLFPGFFQVRGVYLTP